jgi:hypothetical protein
MRYMSVWYDQEVLIGNWTLREGCIEMISCLENEMLFNVGIIYAKPAISIFDHLDL